MWAASLGINFELVDPTTVANPTEPLLRNRTTSGGTPLCAHQDRVHLSTDGYMELVAMLVKLANGEDEDTSLDEGASSASECAKRKRPESVVMVPT